MKLEKVKPEDVVYSLVKHKAGNTQLRTTSLYYVHIVSVDIENQTCTARWNGNKEKTYYRAEWSKWRVNKPLMVRGFAGTQRLATREEIAAHKAEIA